MLTYADLCYAARYAFPGGAIAFEKPHHRPAVRARAPYTHPHAPTLAEPHHAGVNEVSPDFTYFTSKKMQLAFLAQLYHPTSARFDSRRTASRDVIEVSTALLV
jgi:hypothetical protein